jgi:hypothetical protein
MHHAPMRLGFPRSLVVCARIVSREPGTLATDAAELGVDSDDERVRLVVIHLTSVVSALAMALGDRIGGIARVKPRYDRGREKPHTRSTQHVIETS